MKMHEICKYYINPAVVPYDVCEIIMNLNTFNEMPPDLQAVMLSASRVQNLDLSALTIPTDARGLKVLADGGMETIMIPDEDLKHAADWCWQRLGRLRVQIHPPATLVAISPQARETNPAR